MRTESRELPAVGIFGILSLLTLAGSLTPRRIALAQQPARPEFEVASVKLNISGRGVTSRNLRPGSINYKNVSELEYIFLAFDVQPWQVIHGSAVSLADRYDIEAKASVAVPVLQMQLMLRSLLEDRFQLKSHRETKELPVYILTVAKGGPHLKASEDEGPMGVFVKEGSMNYRRTSTAYLAGRVFSNIPSLGRPVVDRTGLNGVCDFSLRMFDPDAPKSETNPKGDTLQQLDNGLNASLKDLGLKLEAQKTPIEMLVIDRVSKPYAN